MAANPNRDHASKRLCIVSRSTLLCAEFVAALQTALSPADELEIVVDRRRGEPQPDSATHAGTDRRHNAHVDRVLKMAGFAIVPTGAGAAAERTDAPVASASGASPTGRDDSDEDQRKLQSILDFQRRQAGRSERPSRDDSGEDRRELRSVLDFQRRQDVQGERFSREESDEDGRELERILKLHRRQEVRVGSWLILTVVLAAGLILIVQLPTVTSFLTRARPAIAPYTGQPASVSEDPPAGSPSQPPPNQQAPTAQDPTQQRAVTPQGPPIAENPPATLPAPTLPPAAAPERREPSRPRDAVAEARSAPRSTPSAPSVAGVTGSSDPRPSADARSSAALNASSRVAAVSNPRFPGLPRVEVFRDATSDRSDGYAVRISDVAGRPLVGAEVLLIARMADGTVENIPMGSGPEPGSYYGTAPSNRSAPVDLRVRVITSDKRVEIPLRP